MTTIYLLRHSQPFRKLLGEYNVNEVIQEIQKLKFPFYQGILKIFYGKDRKIINNE